MLQSDGKILVGGDYVPATGGLYFLVARFNATDGSLDTSFGAGGIAIASGSHAYTRKGGMALEPDGRIVLAGSQLPVVNGSWTSAALTRFLAAGPHPELLPDASAPERGHFLTFRLPDAAAVHAALHARGVIVDYRDDRLRIGFGLYHGDDDVDELVRRLAPVPAWPRF